MNSGLKRVRQFLSKLNVYDYALLLGAISIFYGAYTIHKPSAFILLGIGLIYIAIKPGGNKPNGYSN